MTIARCILVSQQSGWELRRLMVRELLRSQVCRSSEEILNTPGGAEGRENRPGAGRDGQAISRP